MPETSTSFSSQPQPPSPPSSSSERERILAEIEKALPALFDLRMGKKKVNAIGFFVSQYWNDEADDAVHGELRPSFGDGEFHRLYEDEENADEDTAAFDGEFSAGVPGFDSNGEMIDAFAAYACESNQDDREYVAYCVWRRRGDGSLERTVVGTVLRPEWEDAALKRKQTKAKEASSLSSKLAKVPKWVGVVVPIAIYLVLRLLTR